MLHQQGHAQCPTSTPSRQSRPRRGCSQAAGSRRAFVYGHTSPDTGLIYLRARTYDPKTVQFLSLDPRAGETRAPYNYAGDNPLNEADPIGLGNWLDLGVPSPGEFLEGLNPVRYYEEEVNDYENGCGYWESVEHGLEGAVVGAMDATGSMELGRRQRVRLLMRLEQLAEQLLRI